MLVKKLLIVLLVLLASSPLAAFDPCPNSELVEWRERLVLQDLAITERIMAETVQIRPSAVQAIHDCILGLFSGGASSRISLPTMSSLIASLWANLAQRLCSAIEGAVGNNAAAINRSISPQVFRGQPAVYLGFGLGGSIGGPGVRPPGGSIPPGTQPITINLNLPSEVRRDERLSLSWTSQNTTSCNLSGAVFDALPNSFPTSGSWSVGITTRNPIGPTQVTITCRNAQGVSQSVTRTVDILESENPMRVRIWTEPETVALNSTLRIFWEAENAEECSAPSPRPGTNDIPRGWGPGSGFIRLPGTTGNRSVSISSSFFDPGDYVARISCRRSSSVESVVDEVTFSVVGRPSLRFIQPSARLSGHTVGQPLTIVWEAENVSRCFVPARGSLRPFLQSTAMPVWTLNTERPLSGNSDTIQTTGIPSGSYSISIRCEGLAPDANGLPMIATAPYRMIRM